MPCTRGLSRSSVANVPRLLLLCAFLPARRFVAWNALRLADDGDALDAAIDKLVVPVLPQLRDGLVRQLFLQRSCIFNCHLESSYLKGVQNNVYCHFLNVSGSAALSGECIAGAHERGRYELTKGGEALRYYQERADAIRKKALPLMDIYREKQAAALHAFQLADAQKPGPRRRVLSAPPLGTLREETLRAILSSHGLPAAEQQRVLAHAAAQRSCMEQVLTHSSITDAFPDLSQEEFAQYAPTLPLSTLFFPKNIRYTYADYRQHLEQTNEYACSHHGYSILPCDTDFHNISISVHEGRWAMISKSNAPAIHFVVRYSKLRDAIENYIDAP